MRHLSGVVLAVACGVSSVGAGAAAGQGVPLYTAHVQHLGRDVEVVVNGVPVSSAAGDLSTLIMQISPFLRDGRNTLEVRWTRTGESTLAFGAKVSRRTTGGTNPEDVVALEPVSNDPLNRPQSRTLTFDAAMPVRWSWEDGDPVSTVGAADRAAILGQVEAIHRAFAQGDPARATGLLETVFREQGLMREGVVERTRQSFERLMAQAGWKVQPLDLARLVVEPFGRLVRVNGPSPLIESSRLEGGNRLLLPSLYFAKIGGSWKVVRRGS